MDKDRRDRDDDEWLAADVAPSTLWELVKGALVEGSFWGALIAVKIWAVTAALIALIVLILLALG